MERRAFMTTIATIPFLGSAHVLTKIQRRFPEWQALTEEYLSADRAWDRNEIDEFEFEEITDPILARRGAVEEGIFAQDVQSIADLAIKTHIADYFDWEIKAFNHAVGRDVQRLAGTV